MESRAYEACQIDPDRVRQQTVLDGTDALVERLGRVVLLDGDGLLGEDRAAVHSFVHEVDGDAGLRHARGKRLPDGVEARERRQKRRVDVDRREPLEEDGREELHVARAHHDLDALRAEPLGHRQVALLARAEVLQLKDGGGDAGALRALEGPHPGLVRGDCEHGQPSVEERLQVRPAA